MKIKKSHIISLIMIIILSGIFIYSKLSKEDKLPTVTTLGQVQTENIKEDTFSHRDENNIKVYLLVADKRYEISIKENSSVFETMEKIQKENTSGNIFDFKYTNNASLGNFITEINGEKGTPGKYWIYYVNNKKASVGVSNYILKEGDIINWSQEGY